VMVLSPVLPAGGPIVVALASRVMLTGVDLTIAGAAFVMGRSARRALQAQDAAAGEKEVSAPQ
jgi:hypothetical protein